jgi:hypothetical protein
MKKLKKPSLSIFVEILKTLAEQGCIDVEPTESGGYDLTPIYDFLVVSQIADRTEERYWLNLVNEDACMMLADLLKSFRKK